MSIQYRPQINGLDAVSTVDLAAVGSSPNANGATISSAQVLNLEPASASFPGVVTTGSQTMAGAKTFSTSVLSPIFSTNAANPAASGTLRLANAGQINWRNSTNDGDVQLYVDSNNDLIFTNGNVVNLDCDLYTSGLQLKDANNSDTVVLFAASVTTSYSITFPPAAPVSASNLLTIDSAGQLGYAQSALPPATGTSGGIPYYNSATSLASSALLAANQLVIGGGAGSAPTTLGSLGTTTTVLHGNASGAPTFGAVSLTADVSGTLPVGNGGTGVASLTANNVILGNGTSAVQFVAPGASGNVLTSNGTTWTSAASGGDVTLAAFGSSPNANGASLSSQVLTLQPASGSFPGGVSTTSQTFAGVKTFSSEPSVPSLDFTSNSKILSGTVDPTSVATSAPIGTLYLNSSNARTYQKQDSGSSTNWVALGASPVITAWADYTPTYNGFTSSASGFKWRQVGSSIEIQGSFSWSAASASEARIGLPNGYVVAAATPAGNGNYFVGSYFNIASTTNDHGGAIIAEPGMNYLTLGSASAFGSTTVNPTSKINGSAIVGTGAGSLVFNGVVTVPISGLVGTNTPTIGQITNWQSYTPTFTAMGTVTNINCYWRQVGQNYEIRARFTTGTVTGSEARMSLPNSGISSSTYATLEMAGGHYGVSTSGSVGLPPLIEPSVAYLTFGVVNLTNGTLSKITGSTIGDNNTVSFTASVQIQGL